MAILRFDPFRDPFRDLDRITNQLMSGTRMPHGMPMDVYKCDNAWHIEMDLPGIDLESIDLIVERNALTVRAALPSTSRNGNRCLGSRVTRDGVAPRAAGSRSCRRWRRRRSR
ncbi:MAG: Hsp20/alpha crystallin family protein [Mycobacterium leprae]